MDKAKGHFVQIRIEAMGDDGPVDPAPFLREYLKALDEGSKSLALMHFYEMDAMLTVDSGSL